MQRAVERVATTFPDPWQVSEWNACERWLPHVLVCATWIEHAHRQTLSAASLLYQTGYYLYERARYAEAERLYQRALEIWEQQLGSSHHRTQLVRHNYVSLLRDMGREGDAKRLEEQL